MRLRSHTSRKGIGGNSLIWICIIGAVLLVVAAFMSGEHESEEKWIPLNTELSTALSRGEDNRTGALADAASGDAAAAVATGDAIADHNTSNEAADAKETGSLPQDTAAAGTDEPPKQEGSAGADNKSGETDSRLDLNRATAEQLDELKGIGPAKAQAIVEERENGGFFSSVDDLQRVKGIGEKLVAGIQDSVVARP